MEPANFDDMRRGLLGPGGPARRHGRRRRVGLAALPVAHRRVLRARPSPAARIPTLGLACVRAWNDWHLDEWVGPRTDRFIPLQLPWLSDPEMAAAEVRRNAERGFRAVSFLEQPVDMGLPSLHTDHWDPFLRACEETGTVVCLHCASSGWSASRSPYAPLELLTTLFPVNALVTCADWLWSGVPVRFPELRICLAESGIDWVPMLINRIDYVMDHSATPGSGGSSAWPADAPHPTECLRRAFWFGVIDLTSSLVLRDHIGVDHIVLESDYPHADSTWPDTSSRAAAALARLPPDEADAISLAQRVRACSTSRCPTRAPPHPGRPHDQPHRPRRRDGRRSVGTGPLRAGRSAFGQPVLERGGRGPDPVLRGAPATSPDRVDGRDAGHPRHQPLRGREVRAAAPRDLQLGHLGPSTSARTAR